MVRWGGQLAENLLWLGETARLALAEDLLSIHHDVEDAAGAFDELGLGPGLLLNDFRQTGGLGVVVSLSAVRDGDLHWSYSSDTERHASSVSARHLTLSSSLPGRIGSATL
jgi:hypothetical protein